MLKALAVDRGFTRIACFGSVARSDAGPSSDFDHGAPGLSQNSDRSFCAGNGIATQYLLDRRFDCGYELAHADL